MGQVLWSQYNHQHGTDVRALGGCGVVLKSPFGTMVNPSLATEQRNFSLALTYANKFLMKKLQSQGLVLHFPLRKQCFVVQFTHFGGPLYSDGKASLGYALQLSVQLSLGLRMNYLYLNIGRKDFVYQGLSGDVGLNYSFSENTRLGMAIHHLNHPIVDSFFQSGYATLMYAGLSHKLSKEVEILAQFKYDLYASTQSLFQTSMGLRYKAHYKFTCYGGIDFTRWEFSFGLNYKLKPIEILLGFNYGQNLGWSPSSSFIFQDQGNE